MPTDSRDVLEGAADRWLLHHQSNAEFRFVEMPAMLTAIDKYVNRTCAQRIRQSIKLGLAQYGADKMP